jgi:hypothetical protein
MTIVQNVNKVKKENVEKVGIRTCTFFKSKDFNEVIERKQNIVPVSCHQKNRLYRTV